MWDPPLQRLLWVFIVGLVGFTIVDAKNTQTSVAGDIASHLTNLRREKMQALKRELSAVGASISVDDAKPEDFTGIRRLRILHEQAMKKNRETITKAVDPKSTATVPTAPEVHPTALPGSEETNAANADKDQPIAPDSPELRIRPRPQNTTITFSVPKLVMITTASTGLSMGAWIGIGVGSAVLLLIIAYVIYKYMQWRPKQIAKKGYRAVARSKGISDDRDVALPPDGILRAGTTPDVVTSPSKHSK